MYWPCNVSLMLGFRVLYVMCYIYYRKSSINVLSTIKTDSGEHHTADSDEFNDIEGVEDIASGLVVDVIPSDGDLVDENCHDSNQSANPEDVLHLDVGDHGVQYEDDISENVRHGGELVVELMNDFSEQNVQGQESVGELESVNGDHCILLRTNNDSQSAVASSHAIPITSNGNVLESEIPEQV